MDNHGGHHKDVCDASASTGIAAHSADASQLGKSRGKQGRNASKPAKTPSNVATHWWIFLLIACNYTQLDLELILSYFFLAESDAGCDYVTDIAKLRLAQFAGTLLWRPVSGYLTDATAHVADWVLLVGVLAELLSLLALMLLPLVAGNGGYSVWLVLGVQLFKALVEIQLSNSVWKIFKMRLEFRFEVATGKQCGILSKVGLMAEQAELWFNLAACGLAAAFVRYSHDPKYTTVKWWFFGAVVLTTLCMLVVTVLMILRGNYFTQVVEDDVDPGVPYSDVPMALGAHVPLLGSQLHPQPASPDAADVPQRSVSVAGTASSTLRHATSKERGVAGTAASRAAAGDKVRAKSVGFRQSSGERRRASSVFRLTRDRMASQEWVGPRSGKYFGAGLAAYATESASYLYNNTVAWRVCVHALLINIPYALIGSSVFFAMPGRAMQSGVQKLVSNFCDGYISNTVQQDSMLNVMYIIGVWLYLLVLRRIAADRYFQVANPVIMVLLSALATLMAFKLNQVLEYGVLSAVLAACWFLFMYDNFLGTAAVSHKYYGFYSFAIGYVQAVPQVAAYAIMTFKVDPTLLLVVSQGVLLCGAAYAAFFGWSSQKELTQAGKGLCAPA